MGSLVNFLKGLIPFSLKRKFIQFRHSGEQYVCPFCGYASKDLELIGEDIPVLKEKHVIGAGTRNGACFKCGASDREKLVFTFLKETEKLFEVKKEKSILHIAPEKILTKFLRNAGLKEYVCGDLHEEGYVYPDYVMNMDVRALPFEDKTFDLVICNHVLEHIEDDKTAMKEIRRVLKDNGKAILQVPISMISESTYEDFNIRDPKARHFAFGQIDHVRIYGRDYFSRLSDAGFNIERIHLAKDFLKNGLNPEEELILCHPSEEKADL